MPTAITIGPVTLIHGDCMDPEVQEMVPTCDLLLDDPPYIGLSGGVSDYKSAAIPGVRGAQAVATATVGDPWGASLDWFPAWLPKVRAGAIVFGGTAMLGDLLTLSPGKLQAVVTWYQRNAMPAARPVPTLTCEFAVAWRRGEGLDWRKLPTHIDVPKLNAGAVCGERLKAPGTNKALHPAQKPVAVMSALLAVCPPGSAVLDVHAGTGTVAVGCIRLGLRCWAVERDPQYFAAAVERCRQEARQPSLLTAGMMSASEPRKE